MLLNMSASYRPARAHRIVAEPVTTHLIVEAINASNRMRCSA
jgi:hypothetical protein